MGLFIAVIVALSLPDSNLLLIASIEPVLDLIPARLLIKGLAVLSKELVILVSLIATVFETDVDNPAVETISNAPLFCPRTVTGSPIAEPVVP